MKLLGNSRGAKNVSIMFLPIVVFNSYMIYTIVIMQ